MISSVAQFEICVECRKYSWYFKEYDKVWYTWFCIKSFPDWPMLSEINTWSPHYLLLYWFATFTYTYGGRVVTVADFKSSAHHCCRFEGHCGYSILSIEEAVQLACGRSVDSSTRAPIRSWNTILHPGFSSTNNIWKAAIRSKLSVRLYR